MSEVLRNATWCHPLCAQDHVDIVTAFESGDRDAARALIVAHAGRSKQTMRRAMSDAADPRRPRFITPGRFSGKVVVVTGAAQGIGEHTARRISAEGGKLVLADRSELVKELADELSGHGPRALAVTADLEHWEGAESAMTQALSAFGRIDVLINNVGGAINFKPFTQFSDTEIRAELDRSLMTTLYACRAALPTMVDRGEGVIVNVSSAATRGIYRIPYSAAKGAINAITASLAMEYADAASVSWRPRPAVLRRHRAGSRGVRQNPSTRPNRRGSTRTSSRPSTQRCSSGTARSTSRRRPSASWPPTKRPTSPARCSPSPAATSAEIAHRLPGVRGLESLASRM